MLSFMRKLGPPLKMLGKNQKENAGRRTSGLQTADHSLCGTGTSKPSCKY